MLEDNESLASGYIYIEPLQDSVVAIQALSKYASLTYLHDIDLRAWMVPATPDDPTHEVGE